MLVKKINNIIIFYQEKNKKQHEKLQKSIYVKNKYTIFDKYNLITRNKL